MPSGLPATWFSAPGEPTQLIQVSVSTSAIPRQRFRVSDSASAISGQRFYSLQ
jgi:hypothetical protein